MQKRKRKINSPIRITTTEAVNMINRNVHGTLLVTLDIETPLDKRMRQTDNPYYGKGIVKKSTINGVIGFRYNKDLSNRGSGGHGKRSWGKLSSNRIFVFYGGRLYLQIKELSRGKIRYCLPSSETVEESDLLEYLPKPSDSDVRDVDMENVKAMRFKRANYEIVSDMDYVAYQRSQVAPFHFSPTPVSFEEPPY